MYLLNYNAQKVMTNSVSRHGDYVACEFSFITTALSILLEWEEEVEVRVRDVAVCGRLFESGFRMIFNLDYWHGKI